MKTPFTLFISRIILVAQLSWSASATAAGPELQSAPVVVTPENLDGLLVAGNSDISKQMSNVLKARHGVEIARGDLVPSLSFSATAVLNPPLFLLNIGTCLIPFLFPSKWTALSAAKSARAAEISGLVVSRLNSYAIALNLLNQHQGDLAVLGVMKEQLLHLKEYVEGLRSQYDIGMVFHADLLMSEGELERLVSKVKGLQNSVFKEKEELRRMLGLSLDHPIEMGTFDELPSALEARPADQSTVEAIYNRAPERQQLEELHAAAKANTHTAIFAFLAGCSGSQGSFGAVQDTNAFSISTSANITIGYGNFPRVSLARDSEHDIGIRESELKLEFGRLLEITKGDLSTALDIRGGAARSVELQEQLLKERMYLAELGPATVKNILESFTSVTAAKLDLIATEQAVRGHRLTLKRLGLEGHFLQVLINAHTALKSAPQGRSGD